MRRGSVAKEARQLAAKERQAVRDSRTNEQQLNKLIGEGHGHCKEAQRLAGHIGEAAIAEVASAWAAAELAGAGVSDDG
jgi:hypothetical protein